MRYAYYALYVILCLFPFAAKGQTQFGLIRGQVRVQGSPAEFINVLIAGTQLGATTNAEGRYQISNVPFGTYEVQFSGIGYVTGHLTVTVSGEVTLNHNLQEDVSKLDEIVVTGTMKEVGKMASSIPVEVYSSSLFRKNPTPNIFEGLNMVNGVQPQLNCNVCGTGDIHINGLEGPYTMVLIDGMPIVSSLSTVYGLSGIPNSMVKRIEVVKGPASTLYGSEAVGGVINIITQDARSASRVQADVFGTGVGDFNADVAASFKAGTATALLGINHFRFENMRDINDDNFIDVVLQNRISIFNKWDFKARSDRPSSIAGRLYYEDRWGGEMQFKKSFRGSDAVYGESIYTKRFELIGTHPLHYGLTFDYSFNYHDQDSYYGTTSYQANQTVTFAQLRWNKQAGSHNLLIGLPFRYIYYDDNTPGTADEAQQNAPGITSLPGIFVQDEIRMGKVTTLVGLRYDHHNVHGSVVTPRLSFKISPTERNVIRLTGGSGFRVVNLFTEDHAALTGARQVVILNELKPEKSWNANLNYVHTIPFATGFMTVDGSMFYTYFTNQIMADFITDPEKIIYDNLDGHAVSQGVSVNVDATFTNNIKLMLGGTYLDVYKIEANTRTAQVLAPRFSGTATVGYSSPQGTWAVDLTARVNGPMYMPVVTDDFRSEESPWVPLLNCQIARHIHGEKAHWEIYGGVKNLLNFIPKNPLLHPDDPFDRPGGKYFDTDGNPRPDTNPYGYTFDTAYNYAPMQGARAFLGVRYILN